MSGPDTLVETPAFIRGWTAPFCYTMDGIKDDNGCWIASATNPKLGHELVELMNFAASQAAQLSTLRSRCEEAERERDAYAKGCEDWQEDCSRYAGEMSAISAAIGSVRFMDPPDGGDVSLAEQVARMRSALEAAEAARGEAVAALERIANPGTVAGMHEQDRSPKLQAIARATQPAGKEKADG